MVFDDDAILAATIAAHNKRRETQKSLKRWEDLTPDSKLERIEEMRAALAAIE